MSGPHPRDATGQLGLDLIAERPRYDAALYVVTDANRDAVRLLDEFLAGAETALALVGPAGAGKTHLLHRTAERCGATVRDAGCDGSGGASGPVQLIDNAHLAAAPRDLLSAVAKAAGGGGKIVIAGAGAPTSWAKGLRDLESRLSAMARITLGEPDEALLEAVINQRFAAMQWRAGAGVAQYAAPRIRRTFDAALAFADAAGREAIAGRRAISIPLARSVIETIDAVEQADEPASRQPAKGWL